MDKRTWTGAGDIVVGQVDFRHWTPEHIALFVELEVTKKRLAAAERVVNMALAFGLEYPPWKSRRHQCPDCARKEGQEHTPDCEWGKAIAAWREQQEKGENDE